MKTPLHPVAWERFTLFIKRIAKAWPQQHRRRAMLRVEVLEAILSLFEAPRYLEIGVESGETFFALTAARKVAVDPHFRFDIDEARRREPHAAFFEAESDTFFGELIGPEDRFEVIYLDGLHTFEQTLRDFCNAAHFLSDSGIIVIDDVVPNSYASSLPNLALAAQLKDAVGDTDQSWMGDVYRLVFFIETFFQQYDYATVTDNHGQLVVWPRQRSAAELTSRGVEEIARMPFESVLIDKSAFRRHAFSEIFGFLQRTSPVR